MYWTAKVIVASPNRYNPEQFRIRHLQCTKQTSINISQRRLQKEKGREEEDKEEEDGGDNDNDEE